MFRTTLHITASLQVHAYNYVCVLNVCLWFLHHFTVPSSYLCTPICLGYLFLEGGIFVVLGCFCLCFVRVIIVVVVFLSGVCVCVCVCVCV